MGYFLVHELVAAGHHVTLLNRGVSQIEGLPNTVARLTADRTDPQQMKRALLARQFDVVVDFVMFKGPEAETIVELLVGRVGHYIAISTGQVYLVREGIERPFKETDYEGRLMPPPKDITYAYEEWLYGMGKRNAEDVLITAHAERQFPYTVLRLPMVNSPHDQFKRLYNYILRLRDGGPILIPQTPNHLLNHIYALDVVKALKLLIDTGKGIGRAYNISQDEFLPLNEFLGILSEIMGLQPPTLVYFKRSELEANGFLPDCSPFSERWMSALNNTRSKEELGMTYTPLRDYLPKLVDFYEANKPRPPVSYKRRPAEIEMAEMTEHSK